MNRTEMGRTTQEETCVRGEIPNFQIVESVG